MKRRNIPLNVPRNVRALRDPSQMFDTWSIVHTDVYKTEKVLGTVKKFGSRQYIIVEISHPQLHSLTSAIWYLYESYFGKAIENQLPR